MRAVLCALHLGRTLLGRQHGAVCLKRFTSQGLLVKQRKHRGIYHGTCAAHFHSSSVVVVEWNMYVSHCTCGALSIALVVRCTPVARDNSGERDIPAPSPAAFLGFSTAASSSPCEFRARRLFQLIEPAADDVQWNGCRPPFVSATRCLFKANSSKKQRCTERYSAPIAQRRLCNSLLLLLLLPPEDARV